MSELLIDPIDLHKQFKRKTMETANNHLDDPLGGSSIDLSWLSFAAKEYNLSPDIKDYVMVPVIIAPANIPNRNGLGFLAENLAAFSPEHGMQYYKTWKGKPTFYEHENKNVVKANGIILDSMLKKANGGYWKVVNYLAFDRSKYTALIQRVLNKDVTTYSMGAYVTGGYACSVCGRQVGNCTHIKEGQAITLNKGGSRTPELGFRLGLNPVGFETSIVETPAWTIADNSAINYF